MTANIAISLNGIGLVPTASTVQTAWSHRSEAPRAPEVEAGKLLDEQ